MVETTDTNEPYVEYYEYLLNKTNDELPQVITNSYGDDEDVRSTTLIYMLRLTL